MQRITLRPGDTRLPLNLGEATSTVFNEGLGVVYYADSNEDAAAGTIAPAANVTLAETTYFWANSETTIRVSSNMASSLASVSAQLVAQDARLDVLDAEGFFYLPAPSGSAVLDTAALVAADAALTARGPGGTIVARFAPTASPYLINAAVTINPHNNLVGVSPFGTVFQLTTAGARLHFYGEGGASGNFSVYGGTFAGPRVATVGLSVGVANQRTFRDIDVRYTAPGGDAVLLSGTQNCHFDTVHVYYAGGNGFGVTNTSGSNVFTNPGVRAFLGWAWSFRQTALDPGGIGYNASLENVIIGGVYEGDNENGGVAQGFIQHLAGLNTRFIRIVIAVGDAPIGVFADIDPAFSNVDSSINFDSPTLVANATVPLTWFDLRRGAKLGLFGTLHVAGGENLFKLDNVSSVQWNIDYTDYELLGESAYPTNFAVKSSGAIPWQSLILAKRYRVREQMFMETVNDPGLAVWDAAGTSNVSIYPNQVNFNGDAVLYRAGPGVLAVTNGLKLGAPKAAADAQALEFFVNSADGKASFKDAGGVTHALY